MRFALPPLRRPRHPLARLLLTLVGVAVLGVFMVFGLIALAVLVAVGGILLLVRQWKLARGQAVSGSPHRSHRADPRHARQHRAAHDGDVLEGEFVVVRDGQHASR